MTTMKRTAALFLTLCFAAISLGSAGCSEANAATYGRPVGNPPVEYFASLAGGAATSLSLPLNGEADGTYLVRFHIQSVQAANNIKIQINGADTNLKCVVGDRLHGSVAVSGSWTIAQAAANPAPLGVGDYFQFEGIFAARTGHKRTYSGSGYALQGAAANGFELLGEYSDTTTPVTSVGIVGSVSTGLATATFIDAVRVLTTK